MTNKCFPGKFKNSSAIVFKKYIDTFSYTKVIQSVISSLLYHGPSGNPVQPLHDAFSVQCLYALKIKCII